MECPRDCPILVGLTETANSLKAGIERAIATRQQMIASDVQHQAIAEQLAGLPHTPDVAEARGSLQEAIVLVGEVQAQLTDSLSLSTAAIKANQTAKEIIFGNCPGEPRLIDDPSRPGIMILACASPGVYDV